jgi:hypothetical protein
MLAFTRSALLLSAIASSALWMHAQFQQPTDEELKMTADPKAPGAAAVYLNIVESTDDTLHYRSFYARIKVLQEKGKELATVEIPYDRNDYKVQNIKARTIHSDGTVIPLTGKPDDLLVAKSGDRQFNRKVFTLPSAEVGSILEYQFDLGYGDDQVSSPLWEIQRPYFVHRAHYGFTPSPQFQKGTQNKDYVAVQDEHGEEARNLLWNGILPPGGTVKTDAIGHYSIDLTDIPPIPNEDWMPPIDSFLYKVSFYYKSAFSSQEFWVAETKRWSKEVDHFAEPSKSIHDAVSSLISPGDNELDKAKKLYKAVQALDNADFSRTKGKAELKQLGLRVSKRAEDTWSQKSGSSRDIALLYLAMLRAAGLTAYDMRVVDRQTGAFSPDYLKFGQLTDDIVIANIDGKETFLDPGEKMCPFGTMSWKHYGAAGARQSPDGRYAAISPLEEYKPNNVIRTGELTLDGHGAMTGSLHFWMNGQEALRWRQLALENDLDEVKKQFDRELESVIPPGVEAHIDHFQALDDPNVNLVALVNVHGSLGAATSKRIMLPGFFFETHSDHPFVDQEKRLEPVDMHYGEVVNDQVTYHLPAGFSVEGVPQDAKISWQGHAVFINKTVPAAGQITISRMLARAFTLAKPEEYQDLRGFYQKVAAADQQQLVLTTAPPATKGN